MDRLEAETVGSKFESQQSLLREKLESVLKVLESANVSNSSSAAKASIDLVTSAAGYFNAAAGYFNAAAGSVVLAGGDVGSEAVSD